VTGFGTLARKEVLEQVRTLRLPLVLVVFLIVGFGSPLLARFTPDLVHALAGSQLTIAVPTPTAADAVDQLEKNLAQFGTLVAILLAMGSVATEKEHGTAAVLLSGPATRTAFVTAKAGVLAGVLLVATGAAAAAAWFYTAILFEPLSPMAFAGAALLLWLELAVFAALTFLGSTLTRSSLAAAGLGLGLLIVLGVLGALPVVGEDLPTGLAAVARTLALEGRLTNPAPIATSLALVGAAIAASVAAFQREEL
jgi:ABC-2 type transport system permease protein